MKLRTLTLRGIPEPVLKALRAAAKRNRRSLNAEVLVRLEVGAAARPAGAAPAAPTAAGPATEGRAVEGDAVVAPVRVGEPAGQPHEVRRAFEEANLSRLRSDLALTPEQRVLLADRMLEDALAVRPRPNVHTIRAFDSWESYLAWKRTDFLP